MADKTNPPEVEDLIRYDVLAQEALRGVVRKVLQEVARTGLPGDHHFYITFDTNAQGVRLSSRMKDKYPEEMTIVIQHQYWDLETTEHGFSIGLSFDNVPETLLIPFSAVTGFFDPAVQFGLQFEVATPEAEEGLKLEKDAQATLSALPSPAKKIEDKVDKKPETAETDGGSADVVSLDAFRKK
ncbi:MAG: SspB family protein [Pseudomonadota bacterium]